MAKLLSPKGSQMSLTRVTEGTRYWRNPSMFRIHDQRNQKQVVFYAFPDTIQIRMPAY